MQLCAGSFSCISPYPLPTLLQPTLPHRLVLTVGLLSSFWWLREAVLIPLFLLYQVTQFGIACLSVRGSDSCQAAFCTQLSPTSSNCFFTLSLESGVPAATCPHRLHCPQLVFWNLSSIFVNGPFIKCPTVTLLEQAISFMLKLWLLQMNNKTDTVLDF